MIILYLIFLIIYFLDEGLPKLALFTGWNTEIARKSFKIV